MPAAPMVQGKRNDISRIKSAWRLYGGVFIDVSSFALIADYNTSLYSDRKEFEFKKISQNMQQY